MKGYVVRKGNQHYAVFYEGLDPITGRERRRWHPAGADRAEAEVLANDLAVERMRDRSPRRSSLTVGMYLTQRWLPGSAPRFGRAHGTATGATWTSTSSRASGESRCATFGPTTSSRSTPGCSPTAITSEMADSTRRPCSRSTWFSGAHSTMPFGGG